MKNRTFFKILSIVMVAGILSTAALVFYTVRLQEHSSLTAFIAGE